MNPLALHRDAHSTREKLARLMTATTRARDSAPAGSPERAKYRAAGVKFERALEIFDKGMRKL